MAQIQVTREQAKGDWLPCCAKCGASADHWRSRVWWAPPAIHFSFLFPPQLLVCLFGVRRVQLTLPFCDLHKRHWFNRNVVVGACLFVFLFAIAAMYFLQSLGLLRPALAWLARMTDEHPLLSVAPLFFGILWILGCGLLMYVQDMAIRPLKVDPTHVLIDGLSREFVRRHRELDDELMQSPLEGTSHSRLPLSPEAGERAEGSL